MPPSWTQSKPPRRFGARDACGRALLLVELDGAIAFHFGSSTAPRELQHLREIEGSVTLEHRSLNAVGQVVRLLGDAERGLVITASSEHLGVNLHGRSRNLAQRGGSAQG